MQTPFIKLATLSRGDGDSCVIRAAYLGREEITDPVTGQRVDFTDAKGGVCLFKGFQWAGHETYEMDPVMFFAGVELDERRWDSRVGRELKVAIPHELPRQAMTRLSIRIGKKLSKFLGIPIFTALHPPTPWGDPWNYHTHHLFGTRDCDGKKMRRWDHKWTSSDLVKRLRELIFTTIKKALEKAGIQKKFFRSAADAGVVAVGFYKQLSAPMWHVRRHLLERRERIIEKVQQLVEKVAPDKWIEGLAARLNQTGDTKNKIEKSDAKRLRLVKTAADKAGLFSARADRVRQLFAGLFGRGKEKPAFEEPLIAVGPQSSIIVTTRVGPEPDLSPTSEAVAHEGAERPGPESESENRTPEKETMKLAGDLGEVPSFTVEFPPAPEVGADVCPQKPPEEEVKPLIPCADAVAATTSVTLPEIENAESVDSVDQGGAEPPTHRAENENHTAEEAMGLAGNLGEVLPLTVGIPPTQEVGADACPQKPPEGEVKALIPSADSVAATTSVTLPEIENAESVDSVDQRGAEPPTHRAEDENHTTEEAMGLAGNLGEVLPLTVEIPPAPEVGADICPQKPPEEEVKEPVPGADAVVATTSFLLPGNENAESEGGVELGGTELPTHIAENEDYTTEEAMKMVGDVKTLDPADVPLVEESAQPVEKENGELADVAVQHHQPPAEEMAVSGTPASEKPAVPLPAAPSDMCVPPLAITEVPVGFTTVKEEVPMAPAPIPKPDLLKAEKVLVSFILEMHVKLGGAMNGAPLPSKEDMERLNRLSKEAETIKIAAGRRRRVKELQDLWTTLFVKRRDAWLFKVRAQLNEEPQGGLPILKKEDEEHLLRLKAEAEDSTTMSALEKDVIFHLFDRLRKAKANRGKSRERDQTDTPMH